MANLVQIDELNNAIQGVLSEYNANVVKGIKKTVKKAMNDLVKDSKATAPVGHRAEHYKDNIAQKTLNEDYNGITKVWYVKGSDYRLTHLLNNGHALRDGGRYAGTQFLTKSVDNITAWYLDKVEEVLRNG